jgi:hypothetical protein
MYINDMVKNNNPINIKVPLYNAEFIGCTDSSIIIMDSNGYL